MINRCLSNIGLTKLRFGVERKLKVEMTLVSGTLTYLKKCSLDLNNNAVLLLNSSWRKRGNPKPYGKVRWIVMGPETFGGGVEIKALVGFVGWTVKMENDGLFRTIRHYVDHGLKPETPILNQAPQDTMRNLTC